MKHIGFWEVLAHFLGFIRLFFIKIEKILKYIIQTNEKGELENKILLYQSETAINNLNPIFGSILFNSSDLCNGDFNIPILFEVLDYSMFGKHKLFGSFIFTINNILENPNKKY